MTNRELIEKAKVQFALPEDIVSTDELAELKVFPRSVRLVALLLLNWKRDASLIEQARVSAQAGKPRQILRDEYGFIFRNSKNPRQTFRKNGLEYTRIESQDLSKLTKPTVTSTRLISLFLKDKKDFLTGESSHLQVDHRIPVSACKVAGIKPKELTQELIDSGEADKHFMAITNRTNCRKREVCTKCLRGEQIELPECIDSSKYKTHFKQAPLDATNPCLGCFYHDHTTTLQKVSWQKLLVYFYGKKETRAQGNGT